MWIKRLIVFLLVLAVLAVAYFWAALSWSYSSGERAGWVQKFSNKGWVCKTWEGELALVSLPGASPEKFFFTVRDEAVARELVSVMGKRVSLHYEEKVGLPTSCFGETRHYVTRVVQAEEIPLGPGVVVPTPPPGTSGVALPPVTAPGTVPAPAPAPAPSTVPAPATTPTPPASR